MAEYASILYQKCGGRTDILSAVLLAVICKAGSTFREVLTPNCYMAVRSMIRMEEGCSHSHRLLRTQIHGKVAKCTLTEAV